MRGARPTFLLVGLTMATLVEGVVLHLVVAPSHPRLAYALEIVAVLTLVWLWQVFASLAHGRVTLDDRALEVHAGRLATVRIPRSNIAHVTRPAWKDLPTPGTPTAVGYVKLSGPSEPTVLITTHAPVAVRLFGLATKQASRVACFVDDPDALVRAAAISGAPPQSHGPSPAATSAG
jgi:hypothetical protein